MGGIFCRRADPSACDEGCHYCRGTSLTGRLQADWMSLNKEGQEVKYKMDVTSEPSHSTLLITRSFPFDEVVIQEHHDFMSKRLPYPLIELLDRKLWGSGTSLTVDWMVHGLVDDRSKGKRGWVHFRSSNCAQNTFEQSTCQRIQDKLQRLAETYLQDKRPLLRISAQPQREAA